MTDKKTDLELMVEYLTANDKEKAVECFHRFIVSTARSLHEELISEDEIDADIDEAMEDDKEDEKEEMKEADEFFGDEDLEDPMAGDMSDTSAADEISGADADDVNPGEDLMVGHEGDAVDAECEVDKVQDVKDAIAELQAKFNELVGDVAGMEAGMGDDMAMGDEGEGDEEVEEAVSHTMGVEEPSEFETDDMGHHGNMDSIKMNSDAKLPESFEYDLTEEDFLSLEEGLQAVSVKMGGEQGEKKFAGEETNTKSPVAQKSKADIPASGKTLVSKQTAHNGYDMEKAPSSDKLPHSGDNSKKNADQGRSKVSKEGDNAALLNKDSSEGFGKGNLKSPIGSKGSKEA